MNISKFVIKAGLFISIVFLSPGSILAMEDNQEKGSFNLKSIGEALKDEDIYKKPKRYKKRLFLGEADFSYTVALLKKHEDNHPELSKAITATEYSQKKVLKQTYPNTFPNNLKYLKENNVNIQFEIDATNIHNVYGGQRFHRIHFNFPHDGKNFKDENSNPIEDLPLAKMINDFFQSASKLQQQGDRIHVALPKEASSFREAFVYRIEDARKNAGYKLIKKHKFDNIRYPGYNHRMTTSNTGALVAEENGREHIFEKTTSTETMKHEVSPNKKHVYRKYRNLLPSINTDDESSSYEEEEIPFEEEVLSTPLGNNNSLEEPEITSQKTLKEANKFKKNVKEEKKTKNPLKTTINKKEEEEDSSEEELSKKEAPRGLTSVQKSEIQNLSAGEIVEWWDGHMTEFHFDTQQSYSMSIAKLTEQYEKDEIDEEKFKKELLRLLN